MKLVRFGELGLERPGIWMNDGRILDVRATSSCIEDYNEHFFSNDGIEQLRNLVTEPDNHFVDDSSVRLGPPISRPSKIICVGANYADHAKEFGHAIPKEPILFSKATTAIIGPTDNIHLPSEAEMVDSEAELAVVIGRKATRVSKHEALAYVAGYTIINDVTERKVQRSNSQWFRGKGFDTFCPLGPFLVTRDELSNLNNVEIQQDHNGKQLQRGNTRDMLFDVPFLIEYISQGMTLLPGDVIATGTPPGIGSARTPKILLKSGDFVTITIDGLGEQQSAVI